MVEWLRSLDSDQRSNTTDVSYRPNNHIKSSGFHIVTRNTEIQLNSHFLHIFRHLLVYNNCSVIHLPIENLKIPKG